MEQKVVEWNNIHFCVFLDKKVNGYKKYQTIYEGVQKQLNFLQLCFRETHFVEKLQ